MSSSFPVSVIITCYNYGRFLANALDSVLAQTVPVGEIIVVDDGSTDNTQAVLSEYKKHEKISYVYQQNRGQARAKNVGLRLAKGPFVAFLDADDSWALNKIEKQAPLFSNPKVGLVYTRQDFVNEQGRPHPGPPRRLPTFRGNVLSEVLKDNFVPFSSVVARRAAFDKDGGFDEKLSMSIDWDLWLRFALNWEFDYVDEPLLHYRVGHPGQMSKNLKTREECCDIIFDAFVNAHGDSLSKRDVQNARAYTWNNRAYALRAKDNLRALAYYRRSAGVKPFQLVAYKGLLLTAWDHFLKKGLAS